MPNDEWGRIVPIDIARPHFRAAPREPAGGRPRRIAFTPIVMVASRVESGELERVLPRYALRGAPVHIVWPSRGFEPAAVKLLRDALVEALAPTLK
jgi:DNA-binding transcriptional LysR family regulator